ncbi:MAG: hypothetical protein IKA17_03690 [Clostridia bacterium]|nr:hypothetical protein [Clostridia bacterium]
MNEKDKTVEFSPVKDVNKERVSRNASDVYSSARKNSYGKAPQNKSDDNNGLIYFAIFLTVALIIAIVVGIIIITNTNSMDKGNEPQENIVIPVEDDIPEVEPEEEPVKEENDYNIIFYGETVKKSGNNYTVAADLYDASLKRVGSRKITITPDTVIRESGKRMSAEGFVYTIESLTGEMISVEGKIREKDNVALTLSYDGSFREEMEEPEESEEPEEIVEEEIPKEESTTPPPEQGGETEPPKTQEPSAGEEQPPQETIAEQN